MKKVLLDTNIIIHREAPRVLNPNVCSLFRWFRRGNYTGYIHPITVDEIRKNSNSASADAMLKKLESYEQLHFATPLHDEVRKISEKIDRNSNDRNDTILLNEVFAGRVDFLITEDKQIHRKAEFLGIQDRVFEIESFLAKIEAENPDFNDYKVLGVRKKLFGEIALADPFFDSFITMDGGKILSFLFLKVEGRDEDYSNIYPAFFPKKRLKIGTFKVISNGIRLGERFLKIIFDHAIKFHVDEIYVTVFNKTDDQRRLINLLLDWGFEYHGTKTTVSGKEEVYVRDFRPNFNLQDPKKTFPFISSKGNIFLVPIRPEYHTELLPDSMLTTESPANFIENKPYRNAIQKVYISRSITRNVHCGDVLIFYRTKVPGQSAKYSSVITTIGIAEGMIDQIANEKEFILKCRKRSVFSDEDLSKEWNYNPRFRPFIINFLYTVSFPLGCRINREKLLKLGILTGEKDEMRGLKPITQEQFRIILRESRTDESLIVN